MKVFDPEKVERWADENAIEHHVHIEVVSASDYDRLLEVYRDLQTKLNIVLLSLSDDL